MSDTPTQPPQPFYCGHCKGTGITMLSMFSNGMTMPFICTVCNRPLTQDELREYGKEEESIAHFERLRIEAGERQAKREQADA